VSNADDERHESTGTYTNRGIPLPGLRPARQRVGLTWKEELTQKPCRSLQQLWEWPPPIL
jgi:hypothetical protein